MMYNNKKKIQLCWQMHRNVWKLKLDGSVLEKVYYLLNEGDHVYSHKLLEYLLVMTA